MSRTMQSMTLGLALTGAALAGAAFVQHADADRVAAPYEQGIACVDVFGLIDLVLKKPELEAARTKFDTDKQAQVNQMQNRLQELQNLVQANPGDPNTQQYYAEGQQLQQSLQQFYQSYQVEMQSLIAGQIGDAYKAVYAAARAQADEEGIVFLFATRPDDDLLVDSLSGVAQEILARPLISPAASLDITEAVRVRMGLPERTDEPTALPTDIGAAEPADATDHADDPKQDD